MDIIDLERLFKVDGIVALITGEGSGQNSLKLYQPRYCSSNTHSIILVIDLISAKALALNSAQEVYINRSNADTLKTAVKESPYANIIPIPVDVTSKASLKSIANKLKLK
jgi:hypothetical protein